MNLIKIIKEKALKMLGMNRFNTTIESDEDRLTFISDREEIAKNRIKEYNVWYEGDSDELLNFYTRMNTIEYYTEPFFARNKRSYFWSISSTEEDIKRTHSGQAKNIIDTLTAIVGIPEVEAGNAKVNDKKPFNKVKKNLEEILKENKFWKMYSLKQVPMTMVEGWGAWKIMFDKTLSQNPILEYYRAENVDFIIKYNRLIGIIFKDFYQDKNGKRYLITETRRLTPEGMVSEEDIYLMNGDRHANKIKFNDVEEFKGTDEDENGTKSVLFRNCKMLFAVPCVFYEDTTGDMYGKSLLTGKLDLLDDLDQALSQSSNAVRKSTPVEYFDTNYLERDKNTGLPVQPHAYDRKYILFPGARNADGTMSNSTPVTATQPQISFEQYNTEAINILLQIINGIISPATLGIDIAKKDNAEAQREKEKVTIFTRNWITKCETDILKDLFNQTLCMKEFMETSQITCTDYDMTISYPEFADESYENKLSILGEAFARGCISPEMYVDKLYGSSLSLSDKQREIEYLKEQVDGTDEEEGQDVFGEQEDNSEDLEDDSEVGTEELFENLA